MAAAEESLGRDDKFQVKIKLFKNVNNVIELKKKAMKGQIQAAVVRPSLVRPLARGLAFLVNYSRA